VTVEQLTHPREPRRVSAEQPPLPLLLVDHHDVLGDPVDVGGGVGDDAQRRIGHDARVVTAPLKSFQRPAKEALLPQSVAAHQSVHRQSALGDPARVLDGRRRRDRAFDVDPVPQHVHDRVDVRLDARRHQLHQPLVARNLADLGAEPFQKVLGYLAEAAVHLDADGGDELPRRKSLIDRG
jgi:hypothetical protein